MADPMTQFEKTALYVLERIALALEEANKNTTPVDEYDSWGM